MTKSNEKYRDYVANVADALDIIDDHLKRAIKKIVLSDEEDYQLFRQIDKFENDFTTLIKYYKESCTSQKQELPSATA